MSDGKLEKKVKKRKLKETGGEANDSDAEGPMTEVDAKQQKELPGEDISFDDTMNKTFKKTSSWCF